MVVASWFWVVMAGALVVAGAGWCGWLMHVLADVGTGWC